MSPTRILVAGAWDDGVCYPRTRALIDGMRAAGVDVETLRVPLHALRGSKVELVRSPWRWPSFGLRLLGTRRRLLGEVARRLSRGPRVDAVLVPYPGHFAVRWVRSVARVPVVLDLFLSAWSTVVEDRELFGRGSLAAKALLAIDRRACRAADLVLLDTREHADLVGAATGLPSERFDWVPIGVPDTGVELRPAARSGPLRVLFFGTGVALHGVRFLCDGVARTESVHLTLVGGSPEERAHAAEVVPPDRLELGDTFESPERLRTRLVETEVVAGAFGTSKKAAAVVPYKVVHGLAAGRAVLTGDTPAVRALLRPGVDCAVAPCGDAGGIARVLGDLAAARGRVAALGAAGRQTYESRFSSPAIGARLSDVLSRVTVPVPAPVARVATS